MTSTPLPRRYFIASGCPIVTTTRYRCLHLQEQLQYLGYDATAVEWFEERQIKSAEALAHDIIVLYRLPMSPPLEQLIASARALHKPVIFDTDDLVFEPELVAWHRAVANLSPAEQTLHREGVRRYLETLQACDAVTAATPLLTELARRHGKPAFVHRNALGEEMLQFGRQLHEQRAGRATLDRVVIAYGSGTSTHDADFREAASALAHVLRRFPQAELWIAGPLDVPRELEVFGERLRRFPLSDWRAWLELASESDIGIAPLEPNNIFCRCKSEVKFIEAGVLGIPVVASDVSAFRNAITDGGNGFIAADESDWVRALTFLIQQPERRAEMGERARQTVLERYSTPARAAELAEILPVLAGRPSELAVAEPRVDPSPVDVPAATSLVINWIIPEPFPGAGGDTGIFRIIRNLADFGHDCHVYVVSYNLMNDYSTGRIRSYIQEHFGDTPAQYHRWSGIARDADCTFATFWPTVEHLLALRNAGQRYYLVQDFEPYFYPVGTHSLLAEHTYRAGLHCITLGRWIARLLRKRFGATADHFDFAVDTDQYWPREEARETRRRICFYARPSTPRRAYEIGLQALQLVNARMPEVEIVLFGSHELAPAPAFPCNNRGLLAPEELARLFSSSEVGLVLSLTNPSFIPLEMLACRCAVVEVASERFEGILTHGEDAWLVEPTPAAIADGIIQLLEDDALRQRLVERGYERTRRMNWQASARQIEQVLLKHASPAALRRRGASPRQSAA